MNAEKKAKELHAKLIEKVKIEEALKDINKSIYVCTQELSDLMFDGDIDSIEIQGIKYKPETIEDYGLDEDITGTDKWDDSEHWFEWLKTNGHGDIIKTKESVHAGTRKSFLNGLRKEGEQLPEWIKIRRLDTIKYNQSAIKRLVNEE